MKLPIALALLASGGPTTMGTASPRPKPAQLRKPSKATLKKRRKNKMARIARKRNAK